MYCKMKQAAQAKVSWGSSDLRPRDLELLTLDSEGFVRLRKLLQNENIPASDTGEEQTDADGTDKAFMAVPSSAYLTVMDQRNELEKGVGVSSSSAYTESNHSRGSNPSTGSDMPRPP